MSIFDDLSKDSFLSKRAANKQSGLDRKADAEAASDLSARNKADAEIASDLSAKRNADAETGTDFSTDKDGSFKAATKKNDTDTVSDRLAKNNVSSDKNPKHDADTEFSSDVTTAGMSKADAEVASDMGYGTGSQYGTQTYSHAGVAFNKVSEGEAKINYAGLLSKDGASEVIGIYGYGSNQNWENVSSVKMSKDYSGNFSGTIPIVSGKNINFAFKDTAENWDNNAGLNYTFVN